MLHQTYFVRGHDKNDDFAHLTYYVGYVDLVEKGPAPRFASGSEHRVCSSPLGVGGEAPNLTKVIFWALDEVVNFVMPLQVKQLLRLAIAHRV